MGMIVRTKNKAHGGITARERALMKDHAELWIARAMRTDPIEPDKIIPAIEGLYAAANLKKPRVVIVPSPLVMAFAYGASAAIWHARKTGNVRATDSATRIATDSATGRATRIATYSATGRATDSATDSATYSATDSATSSATGRATGRATDSATDSATYSATDSATYSATYSATDSATDSATRIATYSATDSATDSATGRAELDATAACRDLAGVFGIDCARRWRGSYQGGNMWAGYDCYLTACRDILGLELREHAAYAHWEQAAIHGGFRVMHEEFCLVSDFPEIIKKDAENLPHCEDGPSHRWRDGWSLYHWHGTRVPGHWIETPETVDPNEILQTENVEERAAGVAIIGMHRMLDKLPHTIIDSDVNPRIGDLIEVSLDGLPEPELYLKFECPRNGIMMEAVNKRELAERTLLHAHAWHARIPPRLFSYAEQRT